MPESKRCIVFATEKPSKDGLYECVQFYAFDEDLIPVENEIELSLDKPCESMKIKDPSLIPRPLSGLNHSHVLASYASLGHLVYRAGGNYYACEQCDALAHDPNTCSTEVEYFDHTASRTVDCWDAINNCWTRLPLMNVSRYWLRLHILKGKLFAVGGYESRDEFRFIEMFDESDGRWISHSYPPDIVKIDCMRFVSAAVEREGFILFASFADDSFYAFRPSGSWERMKHLPFDCDAMFVQCWHSPAAVVDNHLLWLDTCSSTLVGFDIDSGTYLKINLASEGLLPRSLILPHFCPQLLHVGNGELALVWRDCCFYVIEGKGKGKVKDREQYNHREASGGTHCCRFSIDFDRAQAGEKCCQLISHQRCIGPHRAHELGAAFNADVGVGVAVGNASNSNNIGRILPGRKRRHSQRLKPYVFPFPKEAIPVEVVFSAESEW